MTRILIAGIGGVGGYFGGLLAKRYFAEEAVDIIFLARGENLKVIQEAGLIIETKIERLVVKPNLATDNVSKIGKVDVVIICTKAYDLEATIQQLKPCINENTIILPLLNGVNNKEKIDQIFPNNLVLNGFVYVISRLVKAGHVHNSGNIEDLYFGLDNYKNERLTALEQIFIDANIRANLSTEISTAIWKKYVFLASIATATTYFNDSIGIIMEEEKKLNVLKKLIEEVISIAKAKNINLPDDIFLKTLKTLKSFPYQATTSMHSDFQNNRAKTEFQSLTAYVVLEGKKYDLELPFFNKLSLEINKKGK